MHALRIAIGIGWILFWTYWIAMAFTAKHGTGGRRRFRATGLAGLSVALILRVFHGGSPEINTPVAGAIGAVMFVAGLAVAIWARVSLGRNWGMPMTEKAEPELVTSGPYRLVRHPVYSGLILAMLGTALTTNVLGLIVVPILGAYFYYSASVEEKNLTAMFPTAYPEYRAATKMLIPFIL